MEEVVVVPQLGICHSKGMTSRLMQTTSAKLELAELELDAGSS